MPRGFVLFFERKPPVAKCQLRGITPPGRPAEFHLTTQHRWGGVGWGGGGVGVGEAGVPDPPPPFRPPPHPHPP